MLKLGLIGILAFAATSTARMVTKLHGRDDPSLGGQGDYNDICKGQGLGWFCPTPGHAAFCNKFGKLVDGKICGKDTCCHSFNSTQATCSEKACEAYANKDITSSVSIKDDDDNESSNNNNDNNNEGNWQAPTMVSHPAGSGRDVNEICEGRSVGWFCPSPGVTAFCNKDHRNVAGDVCGKDTCCSVIDGAAVCSQEACEQYGNSTRPAYQWRRK